MGKFLGLHAKQPLVWTRTSIETLETRKACEGWTIFVVFTHTPRPVGRRIVLP